MNTTSDSLRVRHPIGVVAERTGLSPELIRVWERRYGVVEPTRDESGQRFYSDAEVERLLLLRQATQGGRGISQVAGLTTEQLATLVRDDNRARAGRDAGRTMEEDVELEASLRYARELDGEKLERQLKRRVAVMGLSRFVEGPVSTLLRKVGDEWHAGRLTPAQEHLATAVVQRVLIGTLASISPAEGAPVFLIGGLPGDRHEVGGLLAASIAAVEGWRVVYLGPDLPPGEIADAARASGAQMVGLSALYVSDIARTVRDLGALRELLPASVPLLVGGAAAPSIVEAVGHPGIQSVPSLETLGNTLRVWAGR
jgi:MerR family transcriptional regulator, light-induced transcriptional regulator